MRRPKAEGRDYLTQELTPSVPRMVGCREERLAEHRVGDGNAHHRTAHLGPDVAGHLAPGDTSVHGIGHRDGGIEVGS